MTESRGVHYTCCPVARVDTLALARVEHIGGTRAEFFEREVTWVREGSATLVLRHTNGDILKEGSTLSDSSSGLFGCLGELLDDAREWTTWYQADPEGLLEVAVVLTVKDVPFEADEIAQGSGLRFAKRYLPCPRDWMMGGDRELSRQWAVGDFKQRDTLMPRVEFIRPRIVVDAETVWSSRNLQDPALRATTWDTVMSKALSGLTTKDADSARDALRGVDPLEPLVPCGACP